MNWRERAPDEVVEDLRQAVEHVIAHTAERPRCTLVSPWAYNKLLKKAKRRAQRTARKARRRRRKTRGW